MEKEDGIGKMDSLVKNDVENKENSIENIGTTDKNDSIVDPVMLMEADSANMSIEHADLLDTYFFLTSTVDSNLEHPNVSTEPTEKCGDLAEISNPSKTSENSPGSTVKIVKNSVNVVEEECISTYSDGDCADYNHSDNYNSKEKDSDIIHVECLIEKNIKEKRCKKLTEKMKQSKEQMKSKRKGSGVKGNKNSDVNGEMNKAEYSNNDNEEKVDEEENPNCKKCEEYVEKDEQTDEGNNNDYAYVSGENEEDDDYAYESGENEEDENMETHLKERLGKMMIIIEEKEDIIAKLKNEARVLKREREEEKEKVTELGEYMKKQMTTKEREVKQKENCVVKLQKEIEKVKGVTSKEKLEELKKKERQLYQRLTTMEKHEGTFRKTIDTQRIIIEDKQKVGALKDKENQSLKKTNLTQRNIIETKEQTIIEIEKTNESMKKIISYWKEFGFRIVDEYNYMDGEEELKQGLQDKEDGQRVTDGKDEVINKLLRKISGLECQLKCYEEEEFTKCKDMEIKYYKSEEKIKKQQKERTEADIMVKNLEEEIINLKENYEELIKDNSTLVEENNLCQENIKMLTELSEHLENHKINKVEMEGNGFQHFEDHRMNNGDMDDNRFKHLKDQRMNEDEFVGNRSHEHDRNKDQNSKTTKIIDTVETGNTTVENRECWYFRRGRCKFKDKCWYVHGNVGGNLRNVESRECMWYKRKEGCKYKDKCKYKHTEEEESKKKEIFEQLGENVSRRGNQRKDDRKECMWYRRKEGCKFKDQCKYKHTEAKKEEKKAESEQQEACEKRMSFLVKSVTQVQNMCKAIVMRLESHGLIHQN